MNKIAIIFAGVPVPGIAVAHPEHASGGGFGLIHFLTDPFHVALLCAAFLICMALLRTALRRQSN